MTSPAAGTASEAGLRLVTRHDLGGRGDGRQVIRSGDTVYVGHLGTSGMGTSILHAADPARTPDRKTTTGGCWPCSAT